MPALTTPITIPAPPALDAPADSWEAEAPAAPAPLGFALFLLLNATLFIRPGEVVPALLGWNIYQFLILLTFAVAFPLVLTQLGSLDARPITVCVLGLLPAIVLSHLANGRGAEAATGGWDHAKTILYYLLFVGLVVTPDRLRSFLWWLGVLSTITAALAVLQYHGAIELPVAMSIDDGGGIDQITGEETKVSRLRGSGIFQDPNDFCILLVVGIILTLYWLTDSESGVLRVLWVGPLFLFLYGLSLTQSRGGLLALLFGLFALLQARFGWRRALVGIGLLLPAVIVVMAGRQTDFSTESGTGQDRLQLWRDGVVLFKTAPVFGIGRDRFAEESGLVAHNSYIHAFAELGFFGGMLFLGAFATALGGLHRLGRPRCQIVDPQLARMRPYLVGMVGGYAAGMMSLSLCYLLPTYTMLALSTTYLSVAKTEPPTPPVRCDATLLFRLTALSVLTIGFFYVIVRLFAH
jgi:hypothetical protein